MNYHLGLKSYTLEHAITLCEEIAEQWRISIESKRLVVDYPYDSKMRTVKSLIFVANAAKELPAILLMYENSAPFSSAWTWLQQEIKARITFEVEQNLDYLLSVLIEPIKKDKRLAPVGYLITLINDIKNFHLT